MFYDARNIENINKLADKTKEKAIQLYDYCKKENINILIYDTIRTKEQQAENIKSGKSKTMKSWHLTGQALDWVLVDSKGTALWNSYKTIDGLKVINYAKSIGFTSGHDWGWDSPHLQYDKIAYGKDTFKTSSTIPTEIKDNSDSTVKAIQSLMNSRYDAKLVADGYYGDKTREALLIALKKEYNENYSKEMGRTIGNLDGSFGSTLIELLSKATLNDCSKVPDRVTYILQASLYMNGHKEIGTLDGKWGDNTTKTLNNFRKSKGFKENGLVGGSTWKELLG